MRRVIDGRTYDTDESNKITDVNEKSIDLVTETGEITLYIENGGLYMTEFGDFFVTCARGLFPLDVYEAPWLARECEVSEDVFTNFFGDGAILD